MSLDPPSSPPPEDGKVESHPASSSRASTQVLNTRSPKFKVANLGITSFAAGISAPPIPPQDNRPRPALPRVLLNNLVPVY